MDTLQFLTMTPKNPLIPLKNIPRIHFLPDIVQTSVIPVCNNSLTQILSPNIRRTPQGPPDSLNAPPCEARSFCIRSTPIKHFIPLRKFPKPASQVCPRRIAKIPLQRVRIRISHRDLLRLHRS